MQTYNNELPGISFLLANSISYKTIHLPYAPRNVEDISNLYDCPLSSIIKTLFFTGDKHIIVCVPGDKSVDKQLLKKVTNVNGLYLASAKETMEIIGLQHGGITPFFESSYLIERILDLDCLCHEKVNIGAGDPMVGMELNSLDLKNIWPGIITNISI